MLSLMMQAPSMLNRMLSLTRIPVVHSGEAK